MRGIFSPTKGRCFQSVIVFFSVHLSGSSWRGSKQTPRRWRRQCRTGGAWRRSGASCRDHHRRGPRSSSTDRSSSILSGCECDQRDSALAPGGRQTGRGPLKIVSGVSKIERRQGYEVLWATIQLERVVASLIWSSSQTDWSNPYCCSRSHCYWWHCSIMHGVIIITRKFLGLLNNYFIKW